MQRVIAAGRTGRKGGKGFYSYGRDGKKGGVDNSIYEFLPTGTARADVHPEEIHDRTVLAMVNEAVRCLEEGVLRSPRDGDVGAVFGLGFPPFRGGPFRYVDAESAEMIIPAPGGAQRPVRAALRARRVAPGNGGAEAAVLSRGGEACLNGGSGIRSQGSGGVRFAVSGARGQFPRPFSLDPPDP